MKQVELTVNGERRTLAVKPDLTLLDALRDELQLTGTKRGCDIGACGACTVIVDGAAILSCMTQAVRCQDKKITTVEGLARNGHLHPLQDSAIAHGAVQCGYCTPGWLLSAKALLDQTPDPTRAEVTNAIAGNFCRCTGYKKIIESILAVGDLGRRPDLRCGDAEILALRQVVVPTENFIRHGAGADSGFVRLTPVRLKM